MAQNRSYLRNQAVALGMIFVCGSLTLAFLMFTALNQGWLAQRAGAHGSLRTFLDLLLFKVAALPLSILALFLLYWLLPNCKVRPARVAPVAILVGVALEGMKYINFLLFRLFRQKLQREYGVFQHSALIVLWAFVAALLVLGGAQSIASGGPGISTRADQEAPT